MMIFITAFAIINLILIVAVTVFDVVVEENKGSNNSGNRNTSCSYISVLRRKSCGCSYSFPFVVIFATEVRNFIGCSCCTPVIAIVVNVNMTTEIVASLSVN